MIAFSSYAYYSIPCLTAWRVARKHFLILHSGVADRSLVSDIPQPLDTLPETCRSDTLSAVVMSMDSHFSTRATRPEDKKFICSRLRKELVRIANYIGSLGFSAVSSVGFAKWKVPFNSLKRRQEIEKAFVVPGCNSFRLDRSVSLHDAGAVSRRPTGGREKCRRLQGPMRSRLFGRGDESLP